MVRSEDLEGVVEVTTRRTGRTTSRTSWGASGRRNNVFSAVVEDDKSELMLISSHGTALRIPMKEVKLLGRVTQGVTLMRFSKDDKVASATILSQSEEENPA